MLSSRRYQVLRALVQEYISTGQPVSSRHLVARYGLNCSSATVRNDLSMLESSGHVHQPHVSSGRVPTDLGYRAFVDGILQSESASAYDGSSAWKVERTTRGVGGDDMIRRTSATLAHLTHYVAVILSPTLGFTRVLKVDLVEIAYRRLLLILITDSGRVVSRDLELFDDPAPEFMQSARRFLNETICGRCLHEVRTLKSSVAMSGMRNHLIDRVVDEIMAIADDADCNRVHHIGVSELAQLPDFAESFRLGPLLNLLEDSLAMLNTLSEAMSDKGLTVRIGSENTRRELGVMSVVMTTYGPTQSDGVVGVIGPTRMDYQRTIAAVRSAAHRLTAMVG